MTQAKRGELRGQKRNGPADRPANPKIMPWRLRRRAACSAATGVSPTWRNRMSGKPEDILAGKNRPFTGKEYLEIAARRPRGLLLRRARRGRDRASGVPQCGALDRAALRFAARSETQGRADLPDGRHQRQLHAQILPRRAFARRPDRPARGDRRMGAHVLRLDGAHARLQGVADEYARRAIRFL